MVRRSQGAQVSAVVTRGLRSSGSQALEQAQWV